MKKYKTDSVRGQPITTLVDLRAHLQEAIAAGAGPALEEETGYSGIAIRNIANGNKQPSPAQGHNLTKALSAWEATAPVLA